MYNGPFNLCYIFILSIDLPKLLYLLVLGKYYFLKLIKLQHYSLHFVKFSDITFTLPKLFM